MGKIKIKYTGTNIGEHNTINNYSSKEFIFDFTSVFDSQKNIIGIEFLFDYPGFNKAPALSFNFLHNEIVSNVDDYSFHIITSIQLDLDKIIMIGNLCKLDIPTESVDNFSFLIFFNKVELSAVFSTLDFNWSITDIKI